MCAPPPPRYLPTPHPIPPQDDASLDAKQLAEARERETGGEVKAASATKAGEALHKRGKGGAAGAALSPRGAAPGEGEEEEEGADDWEENQKWE